MGTQEANRYAASPFGFESLDVYKAARELRKKIYGVAKSLPAEEKYSLAKQMREAAVSITNNLAEGHGRYNWQDNSRFCRIARGSLFEIEDDINVCEDEQYISPQQAAELRADAAKVLRLLNGYVSYLQRKKNGPENQDA